VNHRLPSGPAAICWSFVPALKPAVTPPVNSVTAPAGVMRAIRPGSLLSTTQRLPSGPAVMPLGPPLALRPGLTPPVSWVVANAGVIRTTVRGP
jgi:hypothetical protein